MGRKGTPRPDKQVHARKGNNQRYIRHIMATSPFFNKDIPPIDLADANAVEERIKWYFAQCANEDIQPTIYGMCNALGTTYQTVFDWETGRRRGETSNHAEIIKSAKQVIKDTYELYLLNNEVNPAAAIFLMHNNLGYKEHSDTNINIKSDPLGQLSTAAQIKSRYRDIIDAEIIEPEQIPEHTGQTGIEGELTLGDKEVILAKTKGEQED